MIAAGTGAETALRSARSHYPGISRLDARLLLLHCLGISLEELIAEPNRQLTDIQAEQFEKLLLRRSQGQPVSQLLGEKEFWGLPFRISRDVLTPRPDSETVVELALEICRGNPPARILDLGTGSGCLMAALLTEFMQAEGVAVDISPAAVTIAEQNFADLELSDRVRLHCADFSDFEGGPFDLIVSNPPYIADADRDSLPVDVRDHEPAMALFAGDGYEAYHTLARYMPRLIAPGGRVVLEIGQGQADRVLTMFELAFNQAGLSARASVKPDLAGIDRAVAFCLD
ncbi:peptide chain release factor N(5)-glutamine methyltransferase [Parvularcula sp. IMCC14364]|uniref:peptide chain release factor N(5)-glutamine methyltransferase n=1 Tax=Parvularcula sp. IMCC14364 TaxID=3067902 RepID=UPI0027412820|nr:peptide chain release factor N(5)-glutamine methyltransferase [Parvularcula sp. IMCC14364]